MVNWKLLTIAGLAYLGSYGCDAALDTRLGYNSLNYGLRQGDIGMPFIVKTAKPMYDLLSGEEPSWNERFQKNEDRFLQGADYLTSRLQLAATGVGIAALLGFRNKKKK